MEYEERLREIIDHIQDVLITRMIYGTNKYDDITIKEFRELINPMIQRVLDITPTLGVIMAIDKVLEDK
jgi:hypothetical protein